MGRCGARTNRAYRRYDGNVRVKSMHPHAPDERYLKRTDLPALGFTEALIKKLLPAPDMTQPARFGYRYWYLRSRVDQAMKEPAFVDALRGRAARAEKP